MPARDVQYNPRKPHSLVSCGDGCKIKFWDARSMVEPLLEFGGHTHWVWQARFNPFHDQLVLVRTPYLLARLLLLTNKPFGNRMITER